jgi:hypothetical protein
MAVHFPAYREIAPNERTIVGNQLGSESFEGLRL